MKISKDLEVLVLEGIIDQSTADKITHFYEQRKSDQPNRLILVFGILSALLIGLGIILILAHNWDMLSRWIKTGLSILPLLASQIFSAYLLFKKKESSHLKEAVSVFLILSIGLSIAMVGQIYHIPGNFDDFLFTWIILSVPVIYLLRSSMASLLCIAGITLYGLQELFQYSHDGSARYVWLIGIVLPYYVYLFRQKPNSNFLFVHHWFVAISLLCGLGTVISQQERWLVWPYFTMLSTFFLIGKWPYFDRQKRSVNSYLVTGFLGMVYILLILTYGDFWEFLSHQKSGLSDLWRSGLLVTVFVLSLIYFPILFQSVKRKWVKKSDPMVIAGVAFPVFFLLGIDTPIGSALSNLVVISIGLYLIVQGARRQKLSEMNLGLTVCTILMMCRFFDAELSFMLRGILFLLIGVGFLLMNLWIIRKKKTI